MEWDQKSRCVCPSCGFVGLPSTRVILERCVQNEVFPKDFIRSFLNKSSVSRLQQVSTDSVKTTLWKTLDFLFAEPPRSSRSSS